MNSIFTDKSIFKNTSTKELQFSKKIFELLSNKKLYERSIKLLKFFLNSKIPLPTYFIKKSVFKQFCGGENLNECQKSIQKLQRQGVQTFLDYSVEASQTEYERDNVLNEIINAIEFASENTATPTVVFKMTGLVALEALEYQGLYDELLESGRERINKIALLAKEKNVTLMVDAEESWYQESIDKLVIDLMLKVNHEKAVIFNTYQLYRKDALDRIIKHHIDLESEKVKFGVKLVRGAYLEKENNRALEKETESILNVSKEDTDKLFNGALEYCIGNLETMAICNASHNEWSNEYLALLMKSNRIEKSDKRVYFTQLYGMSNHISLKLAQEGYNSSKYLPYGKLKKVIPYLIRRSEENQAIEGQIGRELSLINEILDERMAS